jgi:hypothetical protein
VLLKLFDVILFRIYFISCRNFILDKYLKLVHPSTAQTATNTTTIDTAYFIDEPVNATNADAIETDTTAPTRALYKTTSYTVVLLSGKNTPNAEASTRANDIDAASRVNKSAFSTAVPNHTHERAMNTRNETRERCSPPLLSVLDPKKTKFAFVILLID